MTGETKKQKEFIDDIGAILDMDAIEDMEVLDDMEVNDNVEFVEDGTEQIM